MSDDHFLPAADPEYRRLQAEINRSFRDLMIVAVVSMLTVLAIAAVVGPRNWQAVNAAHQAEVV